MIGERVGGDGEQALVAHRGGHGFAQQPGRVAEPGLASAAAQIGKTHDVPRAVHNRQREGGAAVAGTLQQGQLQAAARRGVVGGAPVDGLHGGAPRQPVRHEDQQARGGAQVGVPTHRKFTQIRVLTWGTRPNVHEVRMAQASAC